MRIALLADIHGNLPALEAVLADLARREVDQVVTLGDHLSGPLLPRETAVLLMAQPWVQIAGNHERQLLSFDPATAGPSDRHAHKCITQEQLAWLRGLPSTAQIDGDVLLCHGSLRSRVGEAGLCPPTLRTPPPLPTPRASPSPRSALGTTPTPPTPRGLRPRPVAPPPERVRPSEASGGQAGGQGPQAWKPSQGLHVNDREYLLESVDAGRTRLATAAEIDQRLGGVTAPVILCGHSHLPRAVKTATGQLLVNPGSVGLPAFDDSNPSYHVVETGSPDARYALLERRLSAWTVSLLSVPYDFEPMANLAEQNARPEWAHALRTGYVRQAG